MIQDTRQARNLCSADEYVLYRDCLGGRLEQLSTLSLHARLERARILRDKYRDIYRRQRGGARGKTTGGVAMEVHDFARTRLKEELFEEILERFKGRLRALDMERRRQEDADRRTSAGQRRRTGQEGRRLKAARADRESHLGRPPNDTGPRPPLGAPPPRPGRAVQGVSARGASGHFRSANRRFQARRDHRR